MTEMIDGCCVCSEEWGWVENQLVYCDGCNLAVHQDCYGIISVPSGSWFCSRCELRQQKETRKRCQLCPWRDGAMKRSDTGDWCHVLCALFIPESYFQNQGTLEPVITKSIPLKRFTKVCYICDQKKREGSKRLGACMPCRKAGCLKAFHVTCAQNQGLLCIKSRPGKDDVDSDFFAYCEYHHRTLKRKSATVRIIPAFKFKSVPKADSATSESASETQDSESPKLLDKAGKNLSLDLEKLHVGGNDNKAGTPRSQKGKKKKLIGAKKIQASSGDPDGGTGSHATDDRVSTNDGLTKLIDACAYVQSLEKGGALVEGGPSSPSHTLMRSVPASDVEMVDEKAESPLPLSQKVIPTPSQLSNSPDVDSGSVPTTLEGFLKQQWTQEALFILEQTKELEVEEDLSELIELKLMNQQLEEEIKVLVSYRNHLRSSSEQLLENSSSSVQYSIPEPASVEDMDYSDSTPITSASSREHPPLSQSQHS